MKEITVLSLFDGISCGQIALERAGIKVNRYFASEIDSNAIKVTQKNYPSTIQIGDVTKVHYKNGVLHTENGNYETSIDVVIGGSPCQGFSFAGKQLNFDDPRSKLFFEYARILKEVNPKYFLLENVTMKKEYEDVITENIGVKPILLNSTLTSAAVRRRLYWSNIPNITEPDDKHISFGDVREHGVSQMNMYYSDKAMNWIHNHEKRTGKTLRIIKDTDKMQMLEATMYKKYSSQRFFGIEDTHGLRYITPLECERCMNIFDSYTSCCSDTQRYKQLGNGWDVGMVTHIFGFMKKDME